MLSNGKTLLIGGRYLHSHNISSLYTEINDHSQVVLVVTLSDGLAHRTPVTHAKWNPSTADIEHVRTVQNQINSKVADLAAYLFGQITTPESWGLTSEP